MYMEILENQTFQGKTIFSFIHYTVKHRACKNKIIENLIFLAEKYIWIIGNNNIYLPLFYSSSRILYAYTLFLLNTYLGIKRVNQTIGRFRQ